MGSLPTSLRDEQTVGKQMGRHSMAFNLADHGLSMHLQRSAKCVCSLCTATCV